MAEKTPLAEKNESADSRSRPLTFEQALEELEAIVHELEEGRLGLDASLERYEQGVRRLRQCYDMLDNAERRIEVLTRVDEDGRPQLSAFDDTASYDDKAGGENAENPKTKRKRKKKRVKAAVKKNPPSGEENVDDTPHLF